MSQWHQSIDVIFVVNTSKKNGKQSRICSIRTFISCQGVKLEESSFTLQISSSGFSCFFVYQTLLKECPVSGFDVLCNQICFRMTSVHRSHTSCNNEHWDDTSKFHSFFSTKRSLIGIRFGSMVLRIMSSWICHGFISTSESVPRGTNAGDKREEKKLPYLLTVRPVTNEARHVAGREPREREGGGKGA